MIKAWFIKKINQYRAGSIPYTDPLTAGRHPFQIYLLSLASVSGVLQLIGSSPPDALQRTLPVWIVLAWSWMLVLGSTSALSGTFWPKNFYATGLTVERIGLFATGMSGIIYGVSIPFYAGLSGLVAGGITVGFGLACIIRARHIGKIFHRALDPTPPPVETEEDL